MNAATQNLENDHIYILRLLDVMEKMVMNCSIDLLHLEMVVDLLKQYVDRFHHAKEENLFFPLLVQKGFSNENGPVSMMLHEHVEGRIFVKGMSDGIAYYKQFGESAVPDIYLNMQGYIDLLRSHIGKENNVLFKMADKVISEAEDEALLKQFSAVEMSDYGKNGVSQVILEIEGLEAMYDLDVSKP